MNTQADLQPGTVIAGEFVVDRLLGRGGMGAVYVVRQRSTNVSRALKVMRPELLNDARLRARFEREATVAAGVASEHVVKVLLAGFDPQTAVPFIVSELLDGEDLEHVLQRRGALPWGEAKLLIAQLCHGLGEAHALGVVHRDLKPENVFVARSHRADVPFTVKILDFGIAKVVADAMRTSQATQSLGTPLFMAPEQADPRGGVSPATDVWALGLVAFRMLTGRIYWLSANHEEAGLSALLAEILAGPMAGASQRLQELGSPTQLPPGFDGWFARCLQRDMRQRFQTASEAWNAFAQIQADPSWIAAPVVPGQMPLHMIPTVTVGPQAAAVSSQPASGASDSGYAGTVAASAGPLGTSVSPGTPSTVAWSGAMTPAGATAQSYSAAAPAVSGPVAMTTPAPTTRRRSIAGVIAAVVAGGAVLLLGGAGVGMALWSIPRTSYCASVSEYFAEPRCISEIDEDAAHHRSRILRVTRKRGRAIRAELINGAGQPVETDTGIATWEFEWGLFGHPRERRVYDKRGRLKAIARFTPDHRTVDMFGPEGHQREFGGNHYTRIRQELDKKGLVLQERYLTEKDAPATDRKGAFGRQARYDARGLQIELLTLGSDGTPSYDDDWLQKVVTTNDERGDPVRFTYTTAQGKPTPNAEDGCYGFVFERDQWGNPTRTTCLGPDGKPAISSKGWSGWGAQYDERGNTTDVRYVGPDGATTQDEHGVAGVKRSFDGRGNETGSQFFAKDGSPMYYPEGAAGTRKTWDDRGNLIETVYLGVDGKPAFLDAAIIRHKYDEQGRRIESAWFDPEGKPLWTRDRVHLEKVRYDDRDNVIERAYFGTDGKPAVVEGGYSVARFKHDEHNREVESSYFGPDGAPVRTDDWISSRRSVWDDWGNEIESSLWGPDGKPTRHKVGHSILKRRYNERNVAIEWTYLNPEGKPTWNNDGVGMIRLKVDALGRELERSYHDTSGRLINDASGTATIRRVIDEKGRAIEKHWFDALGRPQVRGDGSSSEKYVYDALGRNTEVSRFDAQGKLVPSRNGSVWATRKLSYDERGFLVQEAYFDNTGAPLGAEDGAAVVKMKRDDHGHVLEWMYFDGTGKPIKTRSGYALVRTNLDARGRQVEWLYFDGEGRRTRNDEGYAASRSSYDDRGFRVESGFFDENDKPVLTTNGIASLKRGWDDRGNQTSERYFGVDGSPKLSRSGFSGTDFKYDDRGLLVERVLLDLEGKPSKSFLTSRRGYDDRGNLVEVTLIDSAGQPGTNSDGVSREKTVRDERGRIAEVSFYDKNEKPVTSRSRGGAVVRYKYDDNGVKREEIVLDASGNVLRTRKYDASGKEVPGG